MPNFILSKLTRRQTLASVFTAGMGGLPARAAGAASSKVRFSLLLVNDVYRMDEDANHRGGMPRLATVVKTERARAAEAGSMLMVVHAGDTLSPSLMSGFDHGAHMIDLFNAVGLDLFVPGNHEFDFGKENYLARMGEARFPILAANLRDADGTLLPHHRDEWSVEAGGLSLAFIGTTLDRTQVLSRADGIAFAPSLDIIREKARAARAAGADFVIAVVHADKPTGRSLMEAHLVDAILSGHNHDLHVDFDGKTALMESNQDANYVVVVDIEIAASKDAGGMHAWWPNFRVIDTASVTPDPDVLAKVRAYQAGLSTTLDVDVARLGLPLDSRSETVRTQESAIGNFIADALRATTGADIALINGGGIRGNKIYPQGAILTRRDILSELPFGNKTIVTTISGKTLLAAIENGLSQADRPSGRFPQVSGLQIRASRTQPPGQRVESVQVAGAALDPARLYRLATNDFMARGGDGYAMLAGPDPITTDSGDELVAQDVMTYAKRMQTIASAVEGRILLQ